MSIVIENESTTQNEPHTALQSIAAEFDTMDWKYTRTAKKIEFRFPARPLTGHCVARLHGHHFILVTVTFGLFIPEHARLEVMRMMNRQNWKLLMGNLEMDEEDGEVRLRYTYPLVAGVLDGERAVGAILQLCSLAGDFAPEFLQAACITASPLTSSDDTAIVLQYPTNLTNTLEESKTMNPIAYFDLDGTLRDTYQAVYPRAHQITIYSGIPERLTALRNAGYFLVGVTNQGGVSTKLITRAEVEQANERTQELLGAARLDLLLYCPHHRDGGDPDCDCKKPAPGMLLDALAALPGSTLEGAFVVGDNPAKDQGAADMLALPFVLAHTFRTQRLDVTLAALPRNENEKADLMKDRIAGALVGMAVGDAFAAPVEFWDRARVRRTYPDGLQTMRKSSLWEKGEYTDDTQMALLLADSLLADGELNASSVAKRFRNWARSAKDVGNQTRRVLRAEGYEIRPEACARMDYEAHPANAAGNGAVMRCAPVALFRAHSVSMLLADSRRSARITHGDPKAQSSCVLINAAIRHLISGGPKAKVWQHGTNFLTPFEKTAWNRLATLSSLKEEEIQSGGYTVSTVEAAFWSFEHSESFSEAVELAASLGDDADTVAGVTGALAGAHYGYRAIPDEWSRALKDEAHLRKTALALEEMSRSAHGAKEVAR